MAVVGTADRVTTTSTEEPILVSQTAYGEADDLKDDSQALRQLSVDRKNYCKAARAALFAALSYSSHGFLPYWQSISRRPVRNSESARSKVVPSERPEHLRGLLLSQSVLLPFALLSRTNKWPICL